MDNGHPQTILISETRDYKTQALDERQVLVTNPGDQFFATFYINGATDLLKVNIVSGTNESLYIPGKTMHALVEAWNAYHNDLKAQEQLPDLPAMFDTCGAGGCMASPAPGSHLCAEHVVAAQQQIGDLQALAKASWLAGEAPVAFSPHSPSALEPEKRVYISITCKLRNHAECIQSEFNCTCPCHEQPAGPTQDQEPPEEAIGKCPACGQVVTRGQMDAEFETSAYLPCHPIHWNQMIGLGDELDASLMQQDDAERPWGEPANYDDTPPEFERDEQATREAAEPALLVEVSDD